ncbi:MAG: hypothetical protein J1E40_07975 [Oscillospiraceae bacterium]|nr:hypothetical protein [Oscillospiraceae bacterium]
MTNRVGRKIYRTNAGNRKRRVQKIFKVILAMIVLAALVFVGYCVAKPVYEYITDRDTSEAEETKPWTPPVAANKSDSDGAGSDTDSEDTSSDDGEAGSENKNVRFSAFTLPVSALANSDTLASALNSAKEGGYTAVIVTLKDKGGKIYYQTDSEMAHSDENAIVGEMYPVQIRDIIKSAGLIPIAKINLLEDNNRYGENRDGSYHFAGDTSTWLDNNAAHGGKPWLSPFDTNTQSYAAYLSNEISSSGYEYIIFDGVSFPPFRNSDLNIIGDIVKSADRYKALVNISNIAASAAEQSGASVMTMFPAAGILDGTAEGFKPAELNTKTLVISYIQGDLAKTAVIGGEEIALSELSAYDKAETVLGEIKRLAGEDITIVPAVRQADYSQADFSDTISALMSLGFDSYIIL